MIGGRKARRGLWVVAGLLAAAGLVSAVALGPGMVRDMDAFRVDRVEVVGTRFLEPWAVITAAGVDRESSVFDPAAAWRNGILDLPLVADVDIRRRPPSTLAIHVREVEPVALVAGDRLVPVDARGAVVALDPAGTVLDLPILVGTELDGERIAGPGGTAALRLLALLVERQPALAERVSQVEVMDRGLRLVFRDGGPDALLPRDVTPTELTQFRVALADLAARGELGRAQRIDVRFRDQVVVLFLRTPVS